MDSSDSHGSTPASTSSNGENEKKNSAVIQSKRALFLQTYERQNFSLPDSIMFYITKNPSTANVYEKMIQVCMDFFVKNPILVISVLDYEGDKWLVNEKPFDLDNLTLKLWITSEFHVHPNTSIKNKAVKESIASSVIPKIYRCDVKTLFIRDQILSFDDLSLVISTAERIFFDKVTIKENDGSIIGIEKMIEVAVNAKEIQIQRPPITSITSKTMKELIKIPNFRRLDTFSMFCIPQTFEIEAFYVFMKKNQHTRFFLDFDNSISDAYKNRLEEINEEILATEIFTYKPAVICFRGMSFGKKLKLVWLSKKKFEFES